MDFVLQVQALRPNPSCEPVLVEAAAALSTSALLASATSNEALIPKYHTRQKSAVDG